MIFITRQHKSTHIDRNNDLLAIDFNSIVFDTESRGRQRLGMDIQIPHKVFANKRFLQKNINTLFTCNIVFQKITGKLKRKLIQHLIGVKIKLHLFIHIRGLRRQFCEPLNLLTGRLKRGFACRKKNIENIKENITLGTVRRIGRMV